MLSNVDELWVDFAMNLLFFLKLKSPIVISDKLKSFALRASVVLDSWITNPDSGFLPFTNSLGITTLNLYTLSSKLLLSGFLLINVGSVSAPIPATPELKSFG